MSKIDWAKRLPLETIKQISLEHSLDYRLVAAICMKESSGNSFATRFEPNYKWVYKVNELTASVGCTANTMMVMQMTSWGLMQVMGAVAYELQFPAKQYCSQLVLPHVGILYGCKLLNRLWSKHSTIEKVVASYNAGNPEKYLSGEKRAKEYVDTVLNYMVQVP